MRTFNGKRLLILGGTTLMCHVVNEAKGLGAYTIVTDRDPKSPAKAVADKAYNISTDQINDLIQLCKNERVDGVFTGYEDFNTSIALILSKELNIPFYATKEQIDITKDKVLFKNVCRKYDVPVVKEYSIENNIDYPVVTKPADSYSGKGITICWNEQELKQGIQFALQFSKENKYLIEKYMDSKIVDCVNIEYVFVDGRPYLSAVGDKYVNNQQGNKTPLTAAVYYPSKYLDEYINQVDGKVKEMFKSLGLKNGTLFIESFHDDEGFHFYEMGYRVGGGQSSILLNKICEVDYVKMLISYALSGKMCDSKTESNINANFTQSACGLFVLIKPGKITKIEGLDELFNHPQIINITQYCRVGDIIPDSLLGTLGQTFGRFHIVTNSKKEMHEVLDEIQSKLKILDEKDKNLLLDVINPKLYQFIKE